MADRCLDVLVIDTIWDQDVVLYCDLECGHKSKKHKVFLMPTGTGQEAVITWKSIKHTPLEVVK